MVFNSDDVVLCTRIFQKFPSKIGISGVEQLNIPELPVNKNLIIPEYAKLPVFIAMTANLPLDSNKICLDGTSLFNLHLKIIESGRAIKNPY